MTLPEKLPWKKTKTYEQLRLLYETTEHLTIIHPSNHAY